MTPITQRRQASVRVHASHMSLWFAWGGFMMLGVGNVLAAPDTATHPGRLSWALQFLGPVFIAVAVTLHVDHLGFRIGRPAVVLFISGSFLLGLSTAHLVISPESWTNRGWSNLAQFLWAIGLLCLSGGLAAIAIHKERQIEHHITQIRDFGDTDRSDVSVHASFLSLIIGSMGFLLYAVGYIQLLEVPGGTRWCWMLQLSGCSLLAFASISHLERLKSHHGRPATVFGILGSIVFAISSIPFAVDPENFASSVFWGQAFWNVWGIGAISASVSILFVIARKRASERL
jgi:hypothetical protein